MELAKTVFGIAIGVLFLGAFIFIRIYTRERKDKKNDDHKK